MRDALTTLLGLGMAAVLTGLATGATACIPVSSSGSCADDTECGADEVCTDLRECSLAERAPSWRISWTINGVAPTTQAPEPCDPIEELELTVTSSTDSLNYTPLACNVGSFGFSSLPVTFNTARLEGRSVDGVTVDGRVTANRFSEPTVLIDLAF